MVIDEAWDAPMGTPGRRTLAGRPRAQRTRGDRYRRRRRHPRQRGGQAPRKPFAWPPKAGNVFRFAGLAELFRRLEAASSKAATATWRLNAGLTGWAEQFARFDRKRRNRFRGWWRRRGKAFDGVPCFACGMAVPMGATHEAGDHGFVAIPGAVAQARLYGRPVFFTDGEPMPAPGAAS